MRQTVVDPPGVASSLVLWLIIFATDQSRYKAAAIDLPFASSFLHAQFAGHRAIYEPVIEQQLSRYTVGDRLSVDDVLHLKGHQDTKDPQILVVDGVASTKISPVGNMQTYLVPLFKILTGKAVLPDLVLASNIGDRPEDDTARHGGPWFGYCNIQFQTTNLLLPAREGVSDRLRCGTNCEPFTNLDRREAKAVFLGSSTGWASGHRQAAVLAGIIHNDSVYSGYTKLIDLPKHEPYEQDNMPHDTKPKMTLADQVRRYKYIINADGHCAALRFRHLLASDSAVFWIESNQVEWFYALLQPFVHYIPLRYDAQHANDDPLPDLVDKITWAEANPKLVAKIIHNANKFAATHLSEHALSCYSFQLLEEYAHLFHDAHKLREIASSRTFKYIHKHS